jgi:hypothetical protein
VARAVKEYLFRIIMGTRNSQSPLSTSGNPVDGLAYSDVKDKNGLYQGGLGVGLTTFYNWYSHNGYRPIVKASAGLPLGDGVGVVRVPLRNSSGDVTYMADVPVFFGLQHIHGHMWERVNGIGIDAQADKSRVYYSPSMYAGDNPHTFDQKLLAGVELPQTQDYIKRVSMHKLLCLPTEVGGGASSETCWCDHFWSGVPSQSYGSRCRLAGGDVYYGATSGTHASSTHAGIGYSHTSVSASLCFFDEDPVV